MHVFVKLRCGVIADVCEEGDLGPWDAAGVQSGQCCGELAEEGAEVVRLVDGLAVDVLHEDARTGHDRARLVNEVRPRNGYARRRQQGQQLNSLCAICGSAWITAGPYCRSTRLQRRLSDRSAAMPTTCEFTAPAKGHIRNRRKSALKREKLLCLLGSDEGLIAHGQIMTWRRLPVVRNILLVQTSGELRDLASRLCTTATNHQPHPVALGIQGTHRRQLRP